MDQDSGDNFYIYHDPSILPTSDVELSKRLDMSAFEPSPKSHKLDDPADAVDEDIDRELTTSYRDSLPNSSGPSEDEAIFDDGDHHSSPSTSHHSDYEDEDDGDEGDNDDVISQFPEDPLPLTDYAPSPPYTPVKNSKERKVFRNPSSVRAMQLDTTPPFKHRSPRYSSPRPQSCQDKTLLSSRNGTPKSGPSRLSPAKKREFPLVLLHVTLIPVKLPYPLDLMGAILSPYIIENYNHLRDRVTDTVLERGILLPHPKEDYELLEERLLESLELKLPRILKCGHFHLPEDEFPHSDSENGDDDDGYDSTTDAADVCDDCGRRVRNGAMGTAGHGSKRWNIKIFAANGLMRAGAWAAAWREMERVDVEIEPWIPEDLRRELDARNEELEASVAAAAAAVAEEEHHLGSLEHDDQPHETIPTDDPGTTPPRHASNRESERQRLREIYGSAPPPPSFSPPAPASASRSSHDRPHHTRKHSSLRPQRQADVPLPTLLKNYLLLLLSDPRNVLLTLLTLVVLLLALRPTTAAVATGAAAAVAQKGGEVVMSSAADVMANGLGRAETMLVDAVPTSVAAAFKPDSMRSNLDERGGDGVGAEVDDDDDEKGEAVTTVPETLEAEREDTVG
ncbi:MAG: hypothetical protein M1833_007257 [Piccolia ochrophora]|nr:MAG: hypothetical protein M1833_007257 [Piccolia ochrophora]